MRIDLTERIQPLADRLAKDLAALMSKRIDAMVAEVEQAFDVALSAAADALATGGGSVEAAAPIVAPVSAPRALSPRSATISPAPAPRHRDLKPDNANRGACSKCGQPGHNARSCGRAPKGPGGKPMDTTSEQPAPRAKAAPDAPPMTAIAPSPRRPAPHEIAAAKARTASRGVSQVIAAMRAARPEPEIEDDATEERWSPERLAAEREAAESNKHAGVMPSPRSTFAVTSKFRGDLNEVRELDFEGGE